MRGRVDLGAGGHDDGVAVDRDVEPAGVVGPRIEGATRLEVEARVVPMTGHETALDRALMEWEAHVRATVFDRKRAAAIPEHNDRQAPDLGDELPISAELLRAPGADGGLLQRHVSSPG